jgi:arylsulfatase A-like enzyme
MARPSFYPGGTGILPVYKRFVAFTTHVPLIFHGPSIKKGLEFSQPASLHDIMPTICRMTGLAVPATSAGTVRQEILLA